MNDHTNSWFSSIKITKQKKYNDKTSLPFRSAHKMRKKRKLTASNAIHNIDKLISRRRKRTYIWSGRLCNICIQVARKWGNVQNILQDRFSSSLWRWIPPYLDISSHVRTLWRTTPNLTQKDGRDVAWVHFFLTILQVPKASATSAVYCAQDYQKYTMPVWQWATCYSNWQWFLPLRRSNVWIRTSSHYTCTWRRLYLQGSASSVHQYRCCWSTRCIRQSRKHSYLWWQWPRGRCKGWHSDGNYPKSERVW